MTVSPVIPTKTVLAAVQTISGGFLQTGAFQTMVTMIN